VSAGSERILVVDDDEAARSLMAAIASKAGYRVTTAADATAMRRILAAGTTDLVLLDVNLPDGDGLGLARELKARSNIGIIMVTERGAPEDRALGIEIGADDYLPKPVFPRELLARIRNVLDRTMVRSDPLGGRLRFAGWSLDPGSRVLEDAQGRGPRLTPAEFDLLAFLAGRPGRILTRDQLIDAVGSTESESGPRSVDILISRLRHKLAEHGEGATLIETCRGHGYRFTPRVTRG